MLDFFADISRHFFKNQFNGEYLCEKLKEIEACKLFYFREITN